MKRSPGIYVFLCMRLLLGVIFIAASIDKIAHPAEFARIVQNYQILPGHLVNIASIVLPWFEALIGAFILCGWWLPGATALASLLLVVFLAALGYAVARGIDVHCGCFSTKASGPAHTAWYFLRDLLFLLLSASVMIKVFRTPPDKGRQL
jgi:uncharacterized membrane protein YphA (DoxX/SURF4 family)